MDAILGARSLRARPVPAAGATSRVWYVWLFTILLYLKLAWAKIKFSSPRRRDTAPAVSLCAVPRPRHGVRLPRLATVSIHHWGGDAGVINTMLRAATGLVAFDPYQLWVPRAPQLRLERAAVHRRPTRGRPAQPAVDLAAEAPRPSGAAQACYGLEFLEFPETHATLSALLPRSHEPTTFDVNTQNANLGRAAAAALARNPRARSGGSAHPGMPTESMFANMGGMF